MFFTKDEINHFFDACMEEISNMPSIKEGFNYPQFHPEEGFPYPPKWQAWQADGIHTPADNLVTVYKSTEWEFFNRLAEPQFFDQKIKYFEEIVNELGNEHGIQMSFYSLKFQWVHSASNSEAASLLDQRRAAIMTGLGAIQQKLMSSYENVVARFNQKYQQEEKIAEELRLEQRRKLELQKTIRDYCHRYGNELIGRTLRRAAAGFFHPTKEEFAALVEQALDKNVLTQKSTMGQTALDYAIEKENYTYAYIILDQATRQSNRVFQLSNEQINHYMQQINGLSAFSASCTLESLKQALREKCTPVDNDLEMKEASVAYTRP